ncbi:MAG: hypothetical protein NTU80_11025 [Verrucomicrobia bacterium]|nr:hypothetical protein [Verrucomicrobiota bacterium]
MKHDDLFTSDTQFGQRLKDIAKLCWNNIDLKAGLLRFTGAKTKSFMECLLAAPTQN